MYMLMLLDGYSLLVGRVVTCGMTKDLVEYGVDDLLSPEEIEEVLAQLEEEWNEFNSRKKRG